MPLRISTGLRNKLNGIETNLASNGTFATDLTGWTTAGANTAQVGTATQGANSTTGYASCAATGGTTKGSISQAITVKPYRFYRISYYIKVGTAAGGEVVVSTAVSGGGTVIEQSAIYTDAAWAQHYLTFYSGANTTVYATFRTSVTTDTQTCFFDEITVIDTSSNVKRIFNKGFLKLYSGSQPSSPDDAPSGNLLVTIYSDGAATGLTFGDSASGVIAKTVSETWSGTAVGSGTQTAGWFRLVATGDTGASSTTEERIDGNVATSGASINMSSTSITNGAVQTISTFQITIPAE